MDNRSALVLVSGGLDSTTLAYLLKQEGFSLTFLSVNYGQRHQKEIHFAGLHAKRLEAEHITIDLQDIRQHLQRSSLTDADFEVPEGHYAADNMKQTVVPNRNAMMLAIAYAIAAGRGIGYVGTAVHSGDHAIYPDCRPEFVQSFSRMQETALEGLWSVGLLAPFVHLTKADIARAASDLGYDYSQTWSCYKGTEIHCGRCGTCIERIEAFQLAGIPDETEYADYTYWRTVTRQEAIVNPQ